MAFPFELVMHRHAFGMQTVPNCQALYKNSFEYHTVSCAPPDFQECFQFLGEQIMNYELAPNSSVKSDSLI